MVKTKMPTEQMIRKDPYKSIINILVQYQNNPKLKYRGGGLMARHFRYALIKGHDEINFEKSTFEGLKHFFQLTLQPLEGLKRITVGCIKSKGHLNVVLRRLRDRGVIKPDKRYGIRRYKIDKQFLQEGEMIMVLDNLQRFNKFNTYTFNLPESDYFLYGISKDAFFSFHENQRVKIKENLIEVEKLIKEIDEIRVSKLLIKSYGYINKKIEEGNYPVKFKQFFYKNDRGLKYIFLDESDPVSIIRKTYNIKESWINYLVSLLNKWLEELTLDKDLSVVRITKPKANPYEDFIKKGKFINL